MRTVCASRGVGELVAGEVGDLAQAVAHRVGVNEQHPRRALQASRRSRGRPPPSPAARAAAGRQRAPDAVEQQGAGPARRRRGRARASRSSAATGRGASGQAVRRTSARPAPRGPSGRRRTGGARSDPRRPARLRSSRPARGPTPCASSTCRRGCTTRRRPCTATSASTPTRSAARRSPSTTPAATAGAGCCPATKATVGASPQPERARPRLHRVVGLAAQHGVDDERLEAGVPGAAGLGGAGVDLGGGEGDLAGEAQHRLAQRPARRPARRGRRRADSTTSTTVRTRSRVWRRVTDRVSSRGAVGEDVAVDRGVVSALPEPRDERGMPAWATSPTYERSSAERARYQSCAASIRRVARRDSSPAARSTRCSVAVDVVTVAGVIRRVYLYAAHNRRGGAPDGSALVHLPATARPPPAGAGFLASPP